VLAHWLFIVWPAVVKSTYARCIVVLQLPPCNCQAGLLQIILAIVTVEARFLGVAQATRWVMHVLPTKACLVHICYTAVVEVVP